MPAEPSSIDCRTLSVMRGGLMALKEAAIRVEKHEWVYVMGPSGGGKTTLLRAIAGLEAPASGEVLIEGRCVSGPGVMIPPHDRGVGMVFQDPPLWPHLTVEANIALPLAGSGRARGETRERVGRWIERLGLGPVARRHPGEISGGEARRAAVAQALVAGPNILLLDEPTNHLDLHLRAELMALLRDLHVREGLTTICVTHQPEPPLAMSDRVCILDEGRVVHDGSFTSLDPESPLPFMKALRNHLGRGMQA